MLSKYLTGAGLAVAAGLLCAPASAAPIGNVTGLHTPNTSNVEQAAYGRCWRSHGRLHSRRIVERYGYAGPYSDDYGYDYGYGYGPAIGFSFRGGHGFRDGHGGHVGGGHGHR